MGSDKAAAGFILTDIKIQLWETHDEEADGRRIAYSMNQATQFSAGTGRVNPSFPTDGPLATAAATCPTATCPVWNDAGLEGGSLAFAGAQFLTLPVASSLSLASSSWSVAVWLKPRWVTTPNGAAFNDLVSNLPSPPTSTQAFWLLLFLLTASTPYPPILSSASLALLALRLAGGWRGSVVHRQRHLACHRAFAAICSFAWHMQTSVLFLSHH